MTRGKTSTGVRAALLAVAGSWAFAAHAASPAPAADEAHARWGLIERYCFECHNTTDWAGGTAFEAMSFDELAADAKVWESSVRKLRAGHWSIQAQVDLHGLRREQAREALAGFLRQARHDGLRCVRVVHGKGLGSPGKTPVLKGKVHSWLVQKNEVLAFVQARADEGGAGALVVLLKPAG